MMVAAVNVSGLIIFYRVAVMVFQSAYAEAYDLTQRMLAQYSDNLLVCLHCGYCLVV